MTVHRRIADDRGAALVTAVLVSALIATATATLLIVLTSGPRASLRQRDSWDARATAASSLEYLHVRLQADGDLFADTLKTTNATSHCWIDNVADASGEPDAAATSDWTQFRHGARYLGDGTDKLSTCGDDDHRQGLVGVCASLQDSCWKLRFKPSPSTADSTPTNVVVESIVRFGCRGSTQKCSVRRFQQQLALRGSEWTRLELTEVTNVDKLTS